MARKKIEPQVAASLVDLIPQYAGHKEEADKLKKICDAENKDIKMLMKTDGVTEKESGGWVAKYIVQKRENINEDMLLDVLHREHYDDLGIIKTKEYIDFDTLESIIYKGELSKETLLEIDKCREVKEVETLRISKVKEKKDE